MVPDVLVLRWESFRNSDNFPILRPLSNRLYPWSKKAFQSKQITKLKSHYSQFLFSNFEFYLRKHFIQINLSTNRKRTEAKMKSKKIYFLFSQQFQTKKRIFCTLLMMWNILCRLSKWNEITNETFCNNTRL